MEKNYLCHIVCALLLVSCTSSGKYDSFTPGRTWEDTDGVHINAHGGGILYHDGKYYWYGEHKSENTSSALVGVNVYSSEDLYNWKKEGVALSVMPEGSGHKIEKGCIIERPKVVYNRKTDKFVMWFHLELKGMGYSAAEYGVAVSDSPEGPFEFLYAQRSCPGIWPVNMTEEEISAAKAITQADLDSDRRHDYVVAGAWLARDIEGGQMSRDMTVFVDDDGTAYHIFASEALGQKGDLDLVSRDDLGMYDGGRVVRRVAAGERVAYAFAEVAVEISAAHAVVDCLRKRFSAQRDVLTDG